MRIAGFFLYLSLILCLDGKFINVSFISHGYAHSGGLDSKGCHGGSKPYHCHRNQSEMSGNRLRCDLGSSSKDCNVQTPSNPQSKMQKAWSNCIQLGFATGTELHLKCVLKLMEN